jgi:hypothetical protein
MRTMAIIACSVACQPSAVLFDHRRDAISLAGIVDERFEAALPDSEIRVLNEGLRALDLQLVNALIDLRLLLEFVPRTRAAGDLSRLHLESKIRAHPSSETQHVIGRLNRLGRQSKTETASTPPFGTLRSEVVARDGRGRFLGEST